MASSSEKAPESSSLSMPRRMFSLRIVNLDYYMASPLPGMDVCYSEFQGRGVREVPVVRIFGSTTSGQKTCLHLHKAFPYFYVPYDSELPQEVNEALAFVRRLASSIEKAMKISSTVGAKRQHLHSCSLVRGKKFYGYHPNEQLFIKIVLYYPQEVSRVSTLLLSGGIMNHKFQPHEAHFPYLLQILIDHNLCGMGHLHLSSLKFRNPLPEVPTDLASLVKRVKRDFTYQEAIPRIETALVDPTKDYSSLKEGLLKEKAVSTLQLSPQPMKEDTVSSLPASRSSSPCMNQAAIKEETLSTLPGSKSPSPAIYQTTIKEETLSTLPAFKSSSAAVHQTTMKEDTFSTLPGSKSSSPAVYQTTPDGGSQPEIWLQKSVPGDWIWPLLASDNMETAIQGQGLYSRQSTCELEADASVEDILNRGDLLFLPIQQAGPEIKMVQSLTPMWEEERARSGEDGPAGSVDPLYQSTARTVPIPSPFEQAMRETLFQIARAEELELGSKNGSQSGSPKSDPGSGTQSVLEICTLLGSQQELKVSLGSTDSGAPSSDEDEPDERQRSSLPLELEPKTSSHSRLESTQTGNPSATLISPHGEGQATTSGHLRNSFGSSRILSGNVDAAKDGGSLAINEELIRKQLSQRCMSQDLDKEVAEFLRWMGTTEVDSNDQEDEHPDDKDGEMAQLALSQIFSSPGMDAALLKALADYENATEQECQAILDCADMMDEEEQDVVDYHTDIFPQGGAPLEAEESEKAFRAPIGRYESYDSRKESDRRGAPPYIPQTDGAGDEDELEDERDRSLRSFSSKRPRHDRQDSSGSRHKHVSFRSGLQGLSKEQRREVSLRDMMRKRRERKPGRKELCSPSSSILEAVSFEVEPEFSKDSAGSLPISDEKHERTRGRDVLQDQTMKVSVMEGSPQTEDLLETTTGGTSLDRHSAYRKKGQVNHKSENRNHTLTSRYGTLPIVTLKYDSADVNCRVEQSPGKDSEGCRVSSREDQGIAEQKSILEVLPECSSQKSLRQNFVRKEVVVGDDITGMRSRGDDRDCGGGQTFFEPCPDSVLKSYINNPRQGTGPKPVEVHPREPDYSTECLREGDVSEDDDYFVAQTQFASTTIPQSLQTSQLHTEGLHVDVEEEDNVDISSEDGEALILSQAPVLAVPQFTTQNQIKSHGSREERRLLDKAHEDSDCVRQTQVVKPDVSYMIEVRPVEVECNVGLQIPHKDGVSVEQTQILSPFIPFLDSRDPRKRHDHIVEIEGLGVADEGDELPGQTQILELENTDVSDVPERMSTGYARIDSDVADVDEEAVNQTQVLNVERPQIDDPHSWESGAILEKVIERDMVDEDAAFVRPTHELEVRSLGDPELSPRESCGYAEGMDGEDGDQYKQSQTLKLEMPSAKEFHSVDTGEYVEELKGGDTPEEGCDSDAQTQILTPEEVLPSTPDSRTTLEVSTSKSLGGFLNTQIPKVLKAELVSSLSSGLPVEVTKNPQETDLHPSFHGERLDGGVGGAGSPADGIKTLDGPNHPGSHPTQYLFCDMSDDSEASYDSEQDIWCRDDGASTAALFDEKEIGEVGNASSADGHLKKRGVTMGRESGWGDATALSPPLSEAEKKDQDNQEMCGPYTVHGDADGNSVGMHSTQYLFTDMTDDSEASYDSGRDGRARDSSWNAAEEFFAEEEKGVESLLVAEEGQSSGWQTGRKSDLGVLENEEHRGMSEEQTRHVSTVHKPLPTEVLVGKKGQDPDFVLAENFDRKDVREYPSSNFSPFKFSNPLESGDLKTSVITSGVFDPSTGKTLLALPVSASDSPHSYSGNASAITKCEVCHVSEEDVKPSAASCFKTVEEEDGKAMIEENDLHVRIDSPLDAYEKLGKVGAIKDATDMQLQIQSYPTPVASKEQHTSWKAALVPFSNNHNDQQLMPLIFHQRPPTREQILESSKEILCHYKEDDVFYGNLKDVSDHPVVRAGLVFDVRSREAVHLRRFQFGISSRRSNFDQGSKHRVYIQQESWGCEEKSDPITGIPTYVENDGTLLYLITPAKIPPPPVAVKQWLSLQSVHREISKGTLAVGQQIFTMDSNTGKLVPLVEIGSPANSQESIPKTESSQEDGELVRPASPKYDERHVFYLTHSSSTIHSSHGFSQRRPSASKYRDQSGNISSVNAPLQQGRKSSHGLPPLAPCTSRTSGPPSPFLAKKNTSKEVPLKKVSSAKPIDSGVKALVNRKLSENVTAKAGKQWRDISQMTGFSPAETPLSQSGFRDPASSGLGQQIILMSIEVFAETRGELLPDPRYDAIGCIALVLHEDGGRASSTNTTVVLIRDKDAHSTRRYPDGSQGCELIYLPDEITLFKCFAHVVRLCDPDMLVGWEVQGFSLGLLAERAANLGISLLKQLSRIPPVSTASSEPFNKEVGYKDQGEAALFDRVSMETIGVDEPIIDDEWGRTHGSGLYIGGRTVLNAWRIMRGEVKLNIYSIEAVAEAVLRRKVPRLPWQTLTRCFMRGPSGGRHHCIEYFINRARLTLEIMEQLDLMNRTAELARVFGIDFYSVFSRGSQFRVESMMARLAHTQNYLLVSPTRQQVAEQPGMQCLPLVMEPESRFYNSPVIVLDFQSLYPSMIIAYNLCFSTCLGKLSSENPKVLGVTKLKLDPGILSGLKDSMTITPNGIMFAPKEVLPGVLPRLLQEILSTRIMVKKAMKNLSPDQRVLERVLNARQFALKLIANVTYGYTAAGFSGRMPCAEIADSIVQCGRLTLERAINMVNTHPRWNARVVYGDTDSMFVLCEGRTKDEAFKIGQEIVASVTETNPPPVTLKLEKVYLPCVLLTKKRYVGYSFESTSQVKPIFDAKGIETIRRDTCPAVAKAVEHSLRILFETQDLSQVKQYLQRQWGKILSGRVSIQDFVFAKEVRLGTYSARSPVLPPAAIVASKAIAVDPRAEPRYAERIPYVVVHGEPGARLVDMVVDPLTLISQPSLRLHDTYYITKQIIPACQRIFMLVGVDLRAWFSEMPRVYRPPTSKRVSNLAMGAKSTRWDPDAGKFKKIGQGLRHGTIDQYFLSKHCTICGEFTRASQLLCGKCFAKPTAAAIILPGRTARLEKEYKHLEAICRHCGGGDASLEGTIACISLDCSVFFERRKVHRELIAAGAVSNDLGYYPPCLPELF